MPRRTTSAGILLSNATGPNISFPSLPPRRFFYGRVRRNLSNPLGFGFFCGPPLDNYGSPPILFKLTTEFLPLCFFCRNFYLFCALISDESPGFAPVLLAVSGLKSENCPPVWTLPFRYSRRYVLSVWVQANTYSQAPHSGLTKIL